MNIGNSTERLITVEGFNLEISYWFGWIARLTAAWPDDRLDRLRPGHGATLDAALHDLEQAVVDLARQ
jgi:hypothetical protein